MRNKTKKTILKYILASIVGIMMFTFSIPVMLTFGMLGLAVTLGTGSVVMFEIIANA